MAIYIGTVHIVIEADDDNCAADGMSELLTGAEESGDGFIVDWGYMQMHGHFLTPKVVACTLPPHYQMGDYKAWL